MLKRLLGLSLAAVLAAPTAALADAASCNARKFSSLSKATEQLLRCEARAAGKGVAPDSDCAVEADTRLADGFDRAQEEGGCPASGETGDITVAMHAFLSDVRMLLVTTAERDRCAAGKLRVTARRVKRELACRRSEPTSPIDPACLQVAQDSLVGGFEMRDGMGHCATTGDAAAVEDLVTGFLTFASDRISGAPGPTPTSLAAAINGADIDLDWTAADPGSGLVESRVLRKLNSAPTGPSDAGASVVYEGAAETATDDLTALLPDTSATARVYHYAVYGCDIDSNCEGNGSHTTLTPTIVQALRAGGYVLHWRHASADVCSDNQSLGKADMTSYPDWWKSCDSNCPVGGPVTATTRQLNAAGRAESVKLGDDFAALGITIGRVRTSEYCRNFETAQLMDFGPVIEEEMGLTYWVYDEANRCNDSFAMLAETPTAGTNTALIGHSGNTCPPLSSLAWAEAAIYKPDGMGSSTYVDRVLAADWLSLP